MIAAQEGLQLFFMEAVCCCEGFASEHLYPTKKELRQHVEELKSSLKAARRLWGSVLWPWLRSRCPLLQLSSWAQMP